MAETKYTRKASARIIKECLKFKPSISGNTSYDQAFVLLMTEWDLELSIEKIEKSVLCSIHKDGNTVHEFKWSVDDAWDDKEMDFNWDYIYRLSLEHIIKTKLYKRPKLSKRELNAIAKAKAEQEKADAKAAAKAEKERLKQEKADAKAAKVAAKLAKLKAKEEVKTKAKTKSKITRKTKA